MAATFDRLLFRTALVISLCSLPPTTPTPVYVVTPAGVLEGTQDTSPNGQPYYAFRGIPYAHPPLGERRWKLPEALPKFDTIYNATGFKPACPQKFRESLVVMDENCLYLDVYVPHNVSDGRVVLRNATKAWDLWMEWQSNHTAQTAGSGSGLPVMVWIHGGAYVMGGSVENEAGKMATDQELVVVVIQYRLGALGFLSSGSSDLPGNYGLWDQRLALKWVKDNIRGFGGDAANVTAAGESAGASSVSQHTLTPGSAGLFRRAVLMSGAAEASWCFNLDPRGTFDRFSKQAGCGNNVTSVANRLQCLMTLTADVIYKSSVDIEFGGFPLLVPTVDGDFFPRPVSRMLQDEDYLSSVGFYDYDFLVGTLNNEGAVMYYFLLTVAPSLPATDRVPYVTVDKYLMDVVLTQELGPRYGPTVRDVLNQDYFYPRSPGEDSAHVRKVFELYSDTLFVVPTIKMVRNHAKMKSVGSSTSSTGSATSSTGSATSSTGSTTSSTGSSTSSTGSTTSSMESSTSSTGSSASSTGSSASSTAESPRSSGKSYMYFFDWSPSLTEGTMFEGMPHALDVDYLWGLTNNSQILGRGTILPREHVVSSMYGDMIGAFVRTGDPNNGIPDTVKGQWLPYDVINETFLRFSQTPTIDHHLNAERVSLWVDLVPRLQSRWLNQTANGDSDSNGPANENPECQEMTYFGISENEANALLIALIVVCGVLLLLCLFLCVKLCRGRHSKGSQYNMDS